MKLKLLWIFLLLSIFLVTGCGKDEQAVDNSVYVKTQTVSYNAQSSEDNYAGTVKGRYESNLAFQVSGKILARNVNVGDSVSAGDVLMIIDDRDIRQNLNVYEAQVQSARSQLELAQTTLSRYEQLYASSAVSAQELDQYKNSYKNALAAYNQAIAQREQGQNALNYTQLTADGSGVISAVTGEAGQVVSAGQTVATIVQDGEREIEISVPENKIQTIRIGQEATVTFWALNNTEVIGAVREIAPMADDVARTYKVRISLKQTPSDIQLGMTANVAFSPKYTGADYITLPLTALYQTENKTQVWIVNSENKAELKDINVVSFGKNDVQVTGLNEGYVVVTAGVHKLFAGQNVKLLDGDAL